MDKNMKDLREMAALLQLAEGVQSISNTGLDDLRRQAIEMDVQRQRQEDEFARQQGYPSLPAMRAALDIQQMQSLSDDREFERITSLMNFAGNPLVDEELMGLARSKITGSGEAPKVEDNQTKQLRQLLESLPKSKSVDGQTAEGFGLEPEAVLRYFANSDAEGRRQLIQQLGL